MGWPKELAFELTKAKELAQGAILKSQPIEPAYRASLKSSPKEPA